MRAWKWSAVVSTPFPLQLRLRSHPRAQAGLQLRDVHAGPNARGQAGKPSEESLGIIFLAEARPEMCPQIRKCGRPRGPRSLRSAERGRRGATLIVEGLRKVHKRGT